MSYAFFCKYISESPDGKLVAIIIVITIINVIISRQQFKQRYKGV